LQERESTCSNKLRVFAQHVGQPVAWDSATKMMDVMHTDIGRKPAQDARQVVMRAASTAAI
jgi:hypothetical protein